ncbi:MAG: LytTR family DNA-binding domain-containing protein [Saprospiraceae bacterium]|nr:LytTR family DNA-binding domain-containing protein [Saprospiraceae bacterium]MCF8250729.1 LytTR family DNA-binding domain-containing protein [Saprospiraceae bacterium]MCF8279786.1 LytTR family DNA-binding domain-containing protein [Bacteroidales bacterium]MCF8310509.1 LytTR family DNA-binding domain-containing protein [Saprospiraceae bacterium]MCF8440859.1 LytTR family DNA-binding domain-containing protein [Saprospiraceae bacterium]
MKKINAFIIDDEISAINTLRGMLERFFPQVKVLEEARSVSDALLKLQRSQPDLVFLDIEMPPFGTGFEFLEKCQNPNFGVIFVTAYPNYAVQAINQIQPWGYLLKPYSVADLASTIQSASAKIEQMEREQKASPASQSILISDARKGNVVIKVGDIIYCQADGATTDIFFLKAGKTTRFTASKTLKDVEELLPSSIFSRSHHSYLVNLSFIERYAHTGRNGVIHLRTGDEVAISVGKMEAFEAQFNNFLIESGQ